jgi:hypothetical protein
MLFRYPTFGSNKIFLSGFTPSYYAAVNDLVIEQSLEQIKEMRCVKFITSRKSDLISGSIPLSAVQAGSFSKSLASGICEGCNVTYVLLQLAYILGYEYVGLLGVDHRYKYKGEPNKQTMCPKKDPNHFSSGYFGGMAWNNPDLAVSETHYRIAKETYEKDGRKIVNLTPKSALKVFPREDWRKW